MGWMRFFGQKCGLNMGCERQNGCFAGWKVRSRGWQRGRSGGKSGRLSGVFLAIFAGVGVGFSGGSGPLWAETCTTQSQMQPADRDALAAASREIAAKLQAGDTAGLQVLMVAEFAKDFAGIRSAALDLSPHLKGDTLVLDGIYLLDAAGLTAGSDAQFFCTLNRSQAEVDFSIAGLSAGMYGFAVVNATGASPWRVSLLLRRDGGRWLLAGFFQGATTAAGHDGLWYWREARRMVTAKQPWNAWLYFGEAQSLLRPASFVQSTHLERLQDERKAAAPPVLSNGISATTPLVVKGPDGAEYRFTGLETEALGGRDKVDALVRLEATGTDAATLRAQSDGAARAIVSAYPELRPTFAGVLVSLEHAGSPPLVTEHLMAAVK